MKINQVHKNPDLDNKLYDPNYNESPMLSAKTENKFLGQNDNYKINNEIELFPHPISTESIMEEHELIKISGFHKKQPKVDAKHNRINYYFQALKKFILKVNKNFIKNGKIWKNFCNYFCNYCLLFTVVANVLGCTAITGALITSRLSHNNIDIDYIGIGIISAVNNIKAAPWMDIIPVDSLLCPKGYILTSMGVWPGTQTGCISYGSEFPNIHNGNCDPKMDILPYENIDQTDSIILNKWKRYSFCVRFAYDYYYAPKCKDGYIQCSFGICYSANESCPISKIFITNEDFVPGSTTTKTSISTNNNGKWLYYKKELRASPIVKIDYTFYNLPCFDKSTKPLEIQYYPLIKNYGKGCGILGLNSGSSIIDFDIEKSFYSLNGLD